MTRRWLQSADVEVDEATGAILVHGDFDSSATPPRSMAGGTKTVAAVNVPEQLTTVATPCHCIWIGPPCSADGVGTNTKPVFLGDSTNQNMPLLPSSISGVVLSIDDASNVYVKVGVVGEGVVFRIFA